MDSGRLTFQLFKTQINDNKEGYIHGDKVRRTKQNFPDARDEPNEDITWQPHRMASHRTGTRSTHGPEEGTCLSSRRAVEHSMHLLCPSKLQVYSSSLLGIITLHVPHHLAAYAVRTTVHYLV
jgi:hypothetical protein